MRNLPLLLKLIVLFFACSAARHAWAAAALVSGSGSREALVPHLLLAGVNLLLAGLLATRNSSSRILTIVYLSSLALLTTFVLISFGLEMQERLVAVATLFIHAGFIALLASGWGRRHLSEAGS